MEPSAFPNREGCFRKGRRWGAEGRWERWEQRGSWGLHGPGGGAGAGRTEALKQSRVSEASRAPSRVRGSKEPEEGPFATAGQALDSTETAALSLAGERQQVHVRFLSSLHFLSTSEEAFTAGDPPGLQALPSQLLSRFTFGGLTITPNETRQGTLSCLDQAQHGKEGALISC